MSETELLPYTDEELAEVTAAIEHEIRTCGSAGGWWDHNQHFISHDRLLATIEAYKAEVEGARNAGINIGIDRAVALLDAAACEHDVDSFVIDLVRELKTTPTGEGGGM